MYRPGACDACRIYVRIDCDTIYIRYLAVVACQPSGGEEDHFSCDLLAPTVVVEKGRKHEALYVMMRL